MKASQRAPRNRVPPLTLALVAALFVGAFSLLPAVSGIPRLEWSFWGATAALLVLWFLLRRRVKQTGRALNYEFVANKVHWVQPLMQGCVYVYWGQYWPTVYDFAPLIAAQLVFAYALDMMVCWLRRDKWILGFGQFPIILSTNLFLWFRQDWFFLQFLMVATGILGKEFIKWERDGRRTHIFNPSALALFVFSAGLILTRSTDISWGQEISNTMARPDHIYLQIFLVGLVVQALFSVTLVTLSAAVTLVILGLVYTHVTGVYNFVDSNIPASDFLGLHLLVTDPATSPRTTLGKILFGSLYGASVFGLYPALSYLDIPRFYDKLLCVPLLNLSVQALDRASRAVTARFRMPDWNVVRKPRLANAAYMAVWISLFGAMSASGFLEKELGHPGGHAEFWQRACQENRVNGCREWVRSLKITCGYRGAEACEALGNLQQEGRLTPKDPLLSGKNFGFACDLGLPAGCSSLAEFVQHDGAGVFLRACDAGDGVSCFILGSQMDSGLGVTADAAKAAMLFDKSCMAGWARGCGMLGDSYRQGKGVAVDLVRAMDSYGKACTGGDATGCANAGVMYSRGIGVTQNEIAAEQLMERACQLGLRNACPDGQGPGASGAAGARP